MDATGLATNAISSRLPFEIFFIDFPVGQINYSSLLASLQWNLGLETCMFVKKPTQMIFDFKKLKE